MARGYRPMFVRACEHACLIRRSARLQRIIFAVQRHRRNQDLRLLPKARFEIIIGRIACRQAEVKTIGMNDDIDEVGIVERMRGPLERYVIKFPVRRPLLPQEPTEGAAMCGETLASTLGLEEMLIPHHRLQSG